MHHRKSTNYNVEWRNSPPFNHRIIRRIRIKFKHSNPNGKISSLPIDFQIFLHRQNQANELVRVQKSSVEREHQLAEDFRQKISALKQEIHQIKKIYDDRVVNLNHEHEEILAKLREEHQLELENMKKELEDLFHIENEAQTKFYLQTIEELKREHQDLLMKELNQNQLGEEFLREKQRWEEEIQSYQNQIEQIVTKSRLEGQEQQKLFEDQSDQYQQLQEEYKQYKSMFNTKSDNLDELNEQVEEIFEINPVSIEENI